MTDPANSELSAAAVEKQLQRILNSPKFLVADQLGRFCAMWSKKRWRDGKIVNLFLCKQ